MEREKVEKQDGKLTFAQIKGMTLEEESKKNDDVNEETRLYIIENCNKIAVKFEVADKEMMKLILQNKNNDSDSDSDSDNDNKEKENKESKENESEKSKNINQIDAFYNKYFEYKSINEMAFLRIENLTDILIWVEATEGKKSGKRRFTKHDQQQRQVFFNKLQQNEVIINAPTTTSVHFTSVVPHSHEDIRREKHYDTPFYVTGFIDRKHIENEVYYEIFRNKRFEEQLTLYFNGSKLVPKYDLQLKCDNKDIHGNNGYNAMQIKQLSWKTRDMINKNENIKCFKCKDIFVYHCEYIGCSHHECDRYLCFSCFAAAVIEKEIKNVNYKGNDVLDGRPKSIEKAFGLYSMLDKVLKDMNSNNSDKSSQDSFAGGFWYLAMIRYTNPKVIKPTSNDNKEIGKFVIDQGNSSMQYLANQIIELGTLSGLKYKLLVFKDDAIGDSSIFAVLINSGKKPDTTMVRKRLNTLINMMACSNYGNISIGVSPPQMQNDNIKNNNSNNNTKVNENESELKQVSDDRNSWIKHSLNYLAAAIARDKRMNNVTGQLREPIYNDTQWKNVANHDELQWCVSKK